MAATSRFLESELDKNKLDKEVANIEIENAKRRFAEDMAGVSYRAIVVKPVKHKIPFKFRFGEWRRDVWNKIKVFLGL